MIDKNQKLKRKSVKAFQRPTQEELYIELRAKIVELFGYNITDVFDEYRRRSKHDL